MTEKHDNGPASSSRAELVRLWTTAGKILAQELRTGCQDRTVIGGLEKFLARWSASVFGMDAAFPTRADAARVIHLLSGYNGMSIQERTLAVRMAVTVAGEVVDRIGTLSSAGSSPAPAVSPPKQSPPGNGARASVGGRTIASPSPASTAKTSAKPGREGAERKAPPIHARRSIGAVSLSDPILTLKGVGKLKASKLARLGIEKVGDLLSHFPRDYRDYSQVKRVADLMYGETASVVGTVEDVQVFPGPQSRFRTTVKVRDDSGRISATWFRYGYGGVRIGPNMRIALAGTVAGYGYSISLDNPDWELAEETPLHTRRLVPVYPLTEGVSDYWLREVMAAVVPACAPQLDEYLPAWLIEGASLPGMQEAVRSVHFPVSRQALGEATRRLAFDEMFVVQVSALKRRAEWQSGARAPALLGRSEVVHAFLASQPFQLTGAQQRVLAEIMADLQSTRPMTRLLEGDVGSGKTIVAAVALLSAVLGGHQGALMAPTEILAEQHGRTLRAIFQYAECVLAEALGRPLRIEVLTGASKRSEREEIYRATEEGEVDILVGTQALIQEGLGFKKLGLAIIDEQHRFGVEQRSALRQKGGTPHLLVMTATPIPRTLALTLYGDLDLSIIDELPPGRQRVNTHLLGPAERVHAYEHVRREVTAGRQAFIICPLVEDNPNLEVRAATAEYERLKSEDLSGLRLALLHGRMRPSEKDRIMLDFKNGLYDVLVSTSVVEVGIDVPNATVMLVEGAERFGMAQLHQFRGRVGRGTHASSCVLLTDSADDSALSRLRTVAEVSDGFRLAEEDLKLRGPGEYTGLRQSGFPDFRMASLGDAQLIDMARKYAAELLKRDPALSSPENAGVARRVTAIQRAGTS